MEVKPKYRSNKSNISNLSNQPNWMRTVCLAEPHLDEVSFTGNAATLTRGSKASLKRRSKSGIRRIIKELALLTGLLYAAHLPACQEVAKDLAAKAFSEGKGAISQVEKNAMTHISEYVDNAFFSVKEKVSKISGSSESTSKESVIPKSFSYKELKYTDNPEKFLDDGIKSINTFKSKNPKLAKTISEVCKEKGIDEDIFYSLMHCESGGNLLAYNKSSGDLGPWQLSKQTAKLIRDKYFKNDSEMNAFYNGLMQDYALLRKNPDLIEKDPKAAMKQLYYFNHIDQYVKFVAPLIKENVISNTKGNVISIEGLSNIARAYNAGQLYVIELKNGKVFYPNTEAYSERFAILVLKQKGKINS